MGLQERKREVLERFCWRLYVLQATWGSGFVTVLEGGNYVWTIRKTNSGFTLVLLRVSFNTNEMNKLIIQHSKSRSQCIFGVANAVNGAKASSMGLRLLRSHRCTLELAPATKCRGASLKEFENQGLVLCLETFDIDVQCEVCSFLRLAQRRQGANHLSPPRIHVVLYSHTLSGKGEKSCMRIIPHSRSHSQHFYLT